MQGSQYHSPHSRPDDRFPLTGRTAPTVLSRHHHQLFSCSCTPGSHYDVLGLCREAVTNQGSSDKRQTRRESCLRSGWFTLGRLGRCRRSLLARMLMFSQMAIFIAWGSHACMGQLGNTHTPVALLSLIFLKTAGITLKGGKA